TASATGLSSGSFTVTVNQAPSITSVNNATFTAGTAGTFTVTASGFPKPTLTTSTLPSGVSFVDNSNGTGILSVGASTAPNAYSITFTASNGVLPNGTQTFTLTVNQAPSITSLNNTTVITGSAMNFPITTTGYPVPTVTEAGALPTGVTF